MDALLTALVAAGLAEWGDRTQLFAILLAARFARPAPLIAGLALAALLNSLIAVAGGAYVSALLEVRPLSLLVGLALLLAGLGSLVTRRTPDVAKRWRTGAFVTAAAGFFLVEFGDKTQFLTFALGARYDSLALTAAGATVGIIAANVPALILGSAFARSVPVRPIRYAIAILLLVAGFTVAVNALALA